MHWKRVKLKRWCCDVCNAMTYKAFKKKHKRSLRQRARAMFKRFLKKDIDA